MDTSYILLVIFSIIPAILVAIVCYWFFSGHIKNEDGRRRYLLVKDTQKDLLPVRLQAFERMTLFLERIKPNNLVVRVKPGTMSVRNYESQLINEIENEFQHNLTQQIYINSETWNVIRSATNATIHIIRSVGMHEKADNVDRFREHILSEFLEKESPSATAIAYLKNDVEEMMG